VSAARLSLLPSEWQGGRVESRRGVDTGEKRKETAVLCSAATINQQYAGSVQKGLTGGLGVGRGQMMI